MRPAPSRFVPAEKRKHTSSRAPHPYQQKVFIANAAKRKEAQSPAPHLSSLALFPHSDFPSELPKRFGECPFHCKCFIVGNFAHVSLLNAGKETVLSLEEGTRRGSRQGGRQDGIVG